MFATLRGEPWLLWRALDEHGIELDILLQKRRDQTAAKRFFKRVLAACPATLKKFVTDHLRSYPAAKAEIPELANVKHVYVKACARVNRRAENCRQPTRECAIFACPNASNHSCRASVRSDSTSRLSGIRCALRCIANSSPRASKNGDFSSVLPRLRPLISELLKGLPVSHLAINNLTAPFDGRVISWSIGTCPDAELVNTILDAAIEKVANSNDRSVVLSDRGAQYRWPGWLSRIFPAPIILARGGIPQRRCGI
jgi:DDE domain